MIEQTAVRPIRCHRRAEPVSDTIPLFSGTESENMTEHATLSDYEAVGGGAAVAAVVDDFYLRVLADPQLAPFFTGVDLSRLKRHQALLVSKVLGGPDAYTGRPLGDAHHGMGISHADFARVVGHLAAALQQAGVPDEIVGRAGAAVLATEPEIVAQP